MQDLDGREGAARVRRAAPPPSRAEEGSRNRQRCASGTGPDVYAENPDGYDDLDIESTRAGDAEGRNGMARGEGGAIAAARGRRATPDRPRGRRQRDAASRRRRCRRSGPRPEQVRKGTVVEVLRGCIPWTRPTGRYLCSLRKSLRIEHSGYSNMLAVGDHVVVSHNGHRQGIVDAILPRRSALARPDPVNNYKQQMIVANVDQLLIVAAWRNPGFWPELVDRYLIGALRNNLAPVIAINKVDLAEDRWDLEGVAQAYRAGRVPGDPDQRGDGARAGRAARRAAGPNDGADRPLRRRQVVLAERGGAGPQSQGGRGERAPPRGQAHHHAGQPASAGCGRVRRRYAGHPRVRAGRAGEGRAVPVLPEFAEPAQSCEYANCTHTREPWCGVKSAMRAGRLSRMRLESYWKILADLDETGRNLA